MLSGDNEWECGIGRVGLTVDLGHDIEPDRGGEDGGERERAGLYGDEDKTGTGERDLPPEVDCTVTVGLAAIAVWMIVALNQGSSHSSSMTWISD